MAAASRSPRRWPTGAARGSACTGRVSHGDTAMNESATLTILLVEDDDVAAEAVVRSLTKSGLVFPVVWAEDGMQALQALRGADPARPVPRPRVTLLDLNMPRMNGFEFLQALRADPGLKDDVVFVLTTSDAETDR